MFLNLSNFYGDYPGYSAGMNLCVPGIIMKKKIRATEINRKQPSTQACPALRAHTYPRV
jgi:hypothetical protein